MSKNEEILNEYGCPEIPYDENVTMYYPSILSAMEEYGKYCAEQALLYFNGNEVGHIEVNEWWSEFQRKEETK